MGGIGEVSTKKEMRGKGLAKILLKAAIQWMKSNDIALSTLHTGSAAPLYASLGWQSIPRIFISKPLQSLQTIEEFPNFPHIFQIRKPQLHDSQEVQLLMEIYHSYAVHFNGILNRSNPEYWSRWISNELNKEAFVLISTATQKPVAFLIFGPEKRDSSILMIKDFFVSTEWFEKDRGRSVFYSFVREALFHHSTLDKSKLSRILYPAACFQQLIDDEKVEILPGLMYSVIASSYSITSLPSLLNDSSNEVSTNHLFWDIDKF